MFAIIIGGTQDERLSARHDFAGAKLIEEIDDSVSIAELAGMAGTMTLMGDTKVFLLRKMFSPKRAVAVKEEGNNDEEDTPDSNNKDKSSELCDMAEAFAQSPHTFIFEEDTLTAKIQTKLEKAGAQIRALKKVEKPKFNVFALGDALARGDRKTLRLLLMQTRDAGIPTEQICGILAWKARTMLASSRTQQERTKNSALSRTLITIYHDSHRGAGDLSLLLERFVLEAK